MRTLFRRASCALFLSVFTFIAGAPVLLCQEAPSPPAQAAPQSESASAPAPARVDRYAQVFDRSADSGKLVAIFLQLDAAATPGESDKAGDSTILISPDGKVMLLDSGAPECAGQVERALDVLGIHRIDAIVASHPHIDHIGGFPAILGKYDVGIVYMSRVDYPTATFRNYMKTLRDKGAEIVYLEEGSQFKFGDRVDVEVYNPESGITYYDSYPDNSTQFVNNKSLVMKFVYGESSVLFMGDVYTSRELDLIGKFGTELRADVMKVGHHGSDTSSSKSLVKLVAPKIAVMIHDSVASLPVYKYYRKIGAATYITFIDGCVKVSGDADGDWTVLTQFDRLSDFLN